MKIFIRTGRKFPEIQYGFPVNQACLYEPRIFADFNRDNPSNGKVNFMKNIRTNIYHCSNPQENPLPAWITAPKKPKVQDIETMEQEKIRKFKECPDSFFPSFCPRSKPGKFRP